jgi:hypothetical protein
LICLVLSGEGRDGLALSLVKSGAGDLAVTELDLAVGLLLPCQGVLHPVLVVTVGEVLTGVSTTGLLSLGGGLGGLDGASQEVTELKSLNKIRVPDHAAVLGANLGELLVDVADLLDTLVERLLGTENGNIGLHDLLHGEADLVGGLGTVGSADLVDDVDGLGTGVSRDLVELLSRGEVVTDGVRNSTTEDDQIEEGVGAKTVSTVDGDAGSLTTGEETGNDLVLALGVLGDDLTGVLGRDTTHVVVDGGKNGDGLLADIDTSEDGGGLGDTGQTLVENLGGQVRKLEVDVVLVGTDTTALTDLHGHGTRDNVTRGKILGGGSVTLHESLTLGVEKVTTLTTRTLGDQTSSAVDTSRVELNELHILVGKTSTGDHGHTVTSASVSRGTREVSTSVTTSGQDGVLSAESVNGTILLVVGNDTLALAVLHDQVGGEVLDEVVGVVAEGLAVESVKKSVTGSVSGGATSVGLATLAELLGLSTEGSLVAVECQYATSLTDIRECTDIFPSSVREKGQP